MGSTHLNTKKNGYIYNRRMEVGGDAPPQRRRKQQLEQRRAVAMVFKMRRGQC